VRDEYIILSNCSKSIWLQIGSGTSHDWNGSSILSQSCSTLGEAFITDYTLHGRQACWNCTDIHQWRIIVLHLPFTLRYSWGNRKQKIHCVYPPPECGLSYTFNGNQAALW